MKILINRIIKNLLRIIYQLIPFSIKNRLYSNEKCDNVLNRVRLNSKSSAICSNIIGEFKYDLTIIIPIYNVEKYVEQCLKSIINQKTKYTFKVILINDGSKDNSRCIVEKYLNYDFIEIIDQENQGVYAARNVGLKNISSKYVMFVDSDDYIFNGTIDNLLDAAYQNDSYIVEGAYKLMDDNGTLKNNAALQSRNNFSRFDFSGFFWGKVYRSSIFSNICNPNYVFEDTLNQLLIYPLYADKGTFINEVVYAYRNNPSSISNNTKKYENIDSFWITESLLNDAKELGISFDEIFLNYYLRQVIVNARRARKLSLSIQKAIFSKECYLLDNFNSVNINDLKLKDIHKILKNHNYFKYLLFSRIQ